MSDASSSEQEDVLVLGLVTKAHGVRGCIKVLPFGPESEIILKIKKIFLKSPETGKLKEFEILTSSKHKRFFLIQLKGVTNINEADALKNWLVCVPMPEHPNLSEDEYYYHELIDMQAYSASGEFLGKIEGFMETPAHDVIVIRNKRKELLLPMIDGVLVEVDKNAKKVVLFTEGLLVENE